MIHNTTLAHEEENKRIGIVLSVALHLLLLLLALFITFSHLDPPPEAPGVIINIGFVDGGNDDENPDQQNQEEVEKPEPKKAPTSVKEKKKVQPTKKAKSKPTPAKVESKVTSDEESKIIAAEKVAKQQKADAAKKKQREEAEEQKLRDAAEQQRKQKEAEEAQKAKEYQESKKKFGDLFGKGKGSNNNNQDQGNPDGKSKEDALDGISKGSGKIGGGLSGRGVVYEPVISDNSQKTGKVVVKVCVDADGNVVSAKYTQKGSTTTNQTLIDIAEGGAKRYKFTNNGAERQCGTVTIDFKLR